MWINVSIILIIVSRFCYTEAIDNHGIHFSKGDRIIYTSDNWNLVLELSTQAIQIPLKQVKEKIAEFHTQANKFTSTIGSNFKSGIEGLIKEITTSLKSEAKYIGERLDSLELITNKQQRTKRGLFNSLGHGIQFITGLATEDQVNSLNEQIKILQDTNKRTLFHVQEQLSFLNESARTLERHDNLIHGMRNSLTLLESAVVDSENRTRSAVSAIDHQSRISIAIQTTHILLSNNLLAIDKEITRLHDVLASAQQGRLTPKLIRPDLFLPILVNISQNLPRGYTLLDTPNLNNIPLIYASASIQFYRMKNCFRFLISLPVLGEGRMFTPYKVQSYPQIYPNLNHSLQIIPDVDMVAVSDDQLRYILFPKSFLSKCVQGDVTLCPPDYPVRDASYSSCVIAAFRQSNNTVASLCSKRVILEPYSIFIPTNTPGEWIYSVNYPTKLNILCQPSHADNDEPSTKPLDIMGHGHLQLSPGCSAVHPQHTLLSTAIFSNPNTVELENYALSIQENFSIPLLTTEHQVIQNLALHKLNPILKSLKSLDTREIPDIPLHILYKDTEIFNPFSMDHHQTKSTIWAVLGSTLLCMLLAGLIFGLLFLLRYSREMNLKDSTSVKTKATTIIPMVTIDNNVYCTTATADTPMLKEEERAQQAVQTLTTTTYTEETTPCVVAPTFFYSQSYNE